MILPDYAAREVLPEADVVLITGSTLVNKSIDSLLELCEDSREVILIGPTASLVPDPLFNRGITAEMGIQVSDTDAMLKVVSEGGGTRQLFRVTKKMALLAKGVD